MNSNGSIVPEDKSRLLTLDACKEIRIEELLEALRHDKVILIRNLDASRGEALVSEVASGFGLRDALLLQAGFAGLYGRRHNIGQYFMSVNKREDYQFITAHSEGTSFSGMQLASFYCYENTTDGGETILMNTDSLGDGWNHVRERVIRAKTAARQFAKHELAQARLYQINLPEDVLSDDDISLSEQESKIPGLTLVTALAKPRLTLSRILDRHVNVYWDSVDSADHDSAIEFAGMLRQLGLLREPLDLASTQMDSDAQRRVWHSGVKYSQLFRSRLVHKLTRGDLIVQNNLTWTHAVNNWSPGSGLRKVAAAFA